MHCFAILQVDSSVFFLLVFVVSAAGSGYGGGDYAGGVSGGACYCSVW